MTPPFSGTGRILMRAIAHLPGKVRSARMQLRHAPSLLLARAGAVIGTGTPVLHNIPAVCEELLGQMQEDKGIIEASKVNDLPTHIALIKQRIFSITVEPRARSRFSLPQMMVVLKRTTSGMEEGKAYRYELHKLTPNPVVLGMVKQGTKVTVSRAA